MDEAVLLNNALAAVCYGPYAIEDWEFHSLMGGDKDEAKALLEQVGKVVEELKAGSSEA